MPNQAIDDDTMKEFGDCLNTAETAYKTETPDVRSLLRDEVLDAETAVCSHGDGAIGVWKPNGILYSRLRQWRDKEHTAEVDQRRAVGQLDIIMPLSTVSYRDHMSGRLVSGIVTSIRSEGVSAGVTTSLDPNSQRMDFAVMIGINV